MSKTIITPQIMGFFQKYFCILDFSVTSTSVPNFIEIKKLGVTHLLIWHGMTQDTNLKEKTSHKNEAPLTTLVGLIFTRNKLCSNYSISQGIDGLISFQAMKCTNICNFSTCGLFAHEIWQR